MNETFPNEDDATPLLDENEDVPEAEETAPAGMRTKLSEQAQEIETLKAQLAEQDGEHRATTMKQAFRNIGLDPEHNIGKAVAVTFEGEPDDLAEFAETEFGYVPVAEHPYAQTIADATARLDAIGSTSGSIGLPSEQDILARAEARGDHETTMAIKSRQMETWFRP